MPYQPNAIFLTLYSSLHHQSLDTKYTVDEFPKHKVCRASFLQELSGRHSKLDEHRCHTCHRKPSHCHPRCQAATKLHGPWSKKILSRNTRNLRKFWCGRMWHAQELNCYTHRSAHITDNIFIIFNSKAFNSLNLDLHLFVTLKTEINFRS